MSARSIFDAVVEPGFRNPNYFEGRLLTAEDLRDDQRAHRERQRLLGRAIGAGVVEGLTVTRESVVTDGVSQTVTVAKGYAINGDGELLWLKQDLTLEVIPQTIVPEPSATLFERCKDTQTPTPQFPVGVGLYILVMSPASGYRERAPKSGLGSEGKIIGCGDRYSVDGVRFRLERLESSMITGADNEQRNEITTLLQGTDDAANRSLLRNLIAHLCFGIPETTSFAVDPFARSDGASSLLTYGALDDLRGLGRLTDCDVPLALLLWDTSGIAFLDLWAVRRRPIPPPCSSDWPLLVGERAVIEGEARLLQFQSQLKELIDVVDRPNSIRATEHFTWLPPVGLLDLRRSGAEGLSTIAFFHGLAVRNPGPPSHAINTGPELMEGARLVPMVQASFVYPAIRTDSAELIWLYRVSEAQRAIDRGTEATERASLVFAAGALPYAGTPRFDLSRWDYANYSTPLTGPGGF